MSGAAEATNRTHSTSAAKSAPNNAMLIIHPYKFSGAWVFDDARFGLVREPFVLGMSEMIDELVKKAGLGPEAEKGFRLIFSARPFPGHQAEIRRLEEDCGGFWYEFADGSMKGWLCPATLHFFSEHPERIYARAEKL